MKSKKWLTHEFQSSSVKTPEFKSFANDFIKDLKSLATGYEFVNVSKGHFYVSGFLKKADKYVYFSISDVRFFRNEWYKNILIRTAKNDKDYTGGVNNSTDLENFKKRVDSLLKIA